MKKNSIKIKIATILLVSLTLTQSLQAGTFYFDVDGKTKYMDDNGKTAIGWRWLDINGDGICECYRFGADGGLATSSTIRGKDVNENGAWVVDGVVQQVFKSSGKPLRETNVDFGSKDTNKYLDLGTLSNSRRINSTKKDMVELFKKDYFADEEAKRQAMIGPDGTFIPTDEGYILSRGATTKLKKVAPVATKSDQKVINTMVEDEIVYLAASTSIVPGRDARKFVTSSNKYTAAVSNVKVYGGYIWNDCICLQGNGAYVKFTLTEEGKRFHANYFTFEVAHQTHGESTADTYCGLELYLNGQSITTYDEFCDGEPELIEEWLDDGEKNMQLKAIVTGDAPGRKIYIRNIRFRMLKEKEDE